MFFVAGAINSLSLLIYRCVDKHFLNMLREAIKTKVL